MPTFKMMMPGRILLIQPDPTSAKSLEQYFSRRGSQVWQILEIPQAKTFLLTQPVDLVFLDLHIPGQEWLDFLDFVNKETASTRIILTNRHPDYQRELLAIERGFQTFLRAPFTTSWIDRAVYKANQAEKGQTRPPVTGSGKLPRVRLPMRVKITFPYILLALVFAFGASFLVSRYILESLQERFTAQLVDVAQLAADWMVQEEARQLETLRLLANSEGLVEAIKSRDAGQIQKIILPVTVNNGEETVHLLDTQGTSLLSLVHEMTGPVEAYAATQGDETLSGLEFVQKVLSEEYDSSGNKYAGLWKGPTGIYFSIAGPVFDDQNQLVGIVIVGNSLASLSQQIRQDTLAQVTFYALDGLPLASTLLVQKEVNPVPQRMVITTLQQQDSQSSIRELQVASAHYTEIIGPLEVRGGMDLGLIGASLAQNFLVRPSTLARFQVLLFVIIAFIGIIILGVTLAYQITSPLSKIVQASIEISRGNLEVKVPSKGNDEVMVLAHAFNLMVSGLQEGFIYRDLLGRTVSPEVREALRRSFATGDVRLEGQNSTATVLLSDIRGFTSLSEKEEPTTILNWLNEYFGEIVPVIASHGGVVDKFEGDSMLAFFGILPTPLTAQESANHACQAAVEMLAVIERINARRVARNEPPLVTGISINCGRLTAGSLGASDRLSYTILGDTVNATYRINDVTRSFGESGIVVSRSTLDALTGKQGNFLFEPLGQHTFKGKKEPLWLYRLFRVNPNKGNH